jgi:superfamily II DNA/RNA helicase
MDAFWTKRNRPRRGSKLIGDFLAHLDQAQDERAPTRAAGRRTQARASSARHTADGESRERLREAFNTPLYPMVLIANEVMQEGLDLHHHCKRVVHHDLAWNPAQLEQRVGRVDRLGALIQRPRRKDAGRRRSTSATP